MTDLRDTLRSITHETAPAEVTATAKLSLLDTLGVGIAAGHFDLSQIITRYAHAQHAGPLPIPFTGGTAAATGVALAMGMTIDALDGHDGYNPAKGHIGCGLVAGLTALALERPTTGADFLTALIRGYEAGARFATTLHATAADYHTSGAWIAPTIALAGGLMRGLTDSQIAHAMGIAEYHGPRSQMMRCIDHPTMLKDGSGWGAMAGVSAILLAEAGFTGAPALTVEGAAWDDLGTRWETPTQYYKPYPVCRWAQGPIDAVLALKRTHRITSQDVAKITIISFHEATRLATTNPQNTEEAQYSTAFPTAIAMVHGDVAPAHIEAAAFQHPEVQRLAATLTMEEEDTANAPFPHRRYARADIYLKDGRRLSSDWLEPRWGPFNRAASEEIHAKFDAWTTPHTDQGPAIKAAVAALPHMDPSTLFPLLSPKAHLRCSP